MHLPHALEKVNCTNIAFNLHFFLQVSADAQIERLQMICKAENLNVEEGALARLIDLTCGDLRRAVNLLQVGGLRKHRKRCRVKCCVYIASLA